MKTLFIIFGVFVIGFANAKPTIEAEIDTLTELRDTVEETVKDVVEASFSKAEAVSAMLNNSIDATLEILPTIPDVDWEANLNDTEDSFKAKKIAMIEALFDAKRQVIRAFAAAKETKTEAIILIFNETLNQIEAAIQATASGLTVSKQFLAEAVADITIENIVDGTASAVNDAHNATLGAILEAKETANEALQDANAVITDAFNSTVTSIQATGQTLIIALVSAKEQVEALLDDFNSQEAIHDKTVSVGQLINSTLQNTEEYVASIGVFEIIDNFIQGIFQGIPNKINSSLNYAVRIPSKINSSLNYAVRTLYGEDFEIEEENEEKNEKELPLDENEDENRPKRDTTSNQEDDNLEGVLKNELKFWNTMNLALHRKRKMLE